MGPFNRTPQRTTNINGTAGVSRTRAMVSALLACASCAAMAQSASSQVASLADSANAATLSSAPKAAASIEMNTVDPLVDSPNGSTARLYRTDSTPQGVVSPELRTRVWWSNGRGALGGGTDWAATPSGSSLRPLRPVVGVRADMTEQTRVVYEVRGPASTLANGTATGVSSGAPSGRESEARMALEFKSAKNPAQNLRNGLLRVQLSNSSALFLKPRSGGMVVSYRSQF